MAQAYATFANGGEMNTEAAHENEPRLAVSDDRRAMNR